MDCPAPTSGSQIVPDSERINRQNQTLPAHSRRYPMTDPVDGYLSSLRLSRYPSAGSVIVYHLLYTGSIWFSICINSI